VILSGAKPVILPTLAADDYVPTAAGLEAVLTPRTRMLILCNPCNPTGSVIGAAQLEALAAVLRRPEYAHVLVLADEIYSEITYDVPHISFAALPGMMERTLTINGGHPRPRPTVVAMAMLTMGHAYYGSCLLGPC
jgi:aspartate/methionine/tyrosine aminotransferase